MDPLGKKELIDFYDRHLRDFGDRPQAVRWTPEGQIRRYEAFLGLAGDLKGKKVLDFGCGKGDFLGFLRARGIECEYHGMDVNENLIAFARSKYPSEHFYVSDIEEEMPDEQYDVIIACGVFNLRISGIRESMENALKRIFDLCGGVFHFNALSSHSYPLHVDLHYVEPEEMTGFIRKELSPHVTLRDDLVKGDLFFSVSREG